MTLICGSMTTFTGINNSKPVLPIQNIPSNTSVNFRKSHPMFRKVSITRTRYLVREGYGSKYAVSVGRTNHQHNLHDNGKDPFWVAPTKAFIRGLRSVFAFLAEQPSQLKYIEWPGFQNTLKTATLTLVLVAMLIVVLSSVESGLWYLLTLILRKPA